METVHLSRAAMTGWIFAATLVSLMATSQCQAWLHLINNYSFAADKSAIVIAVYGAVVGIGGPPAVGFLLEKLASPIIYKWGYNMWNFPCALLLEPQIKPDWAEHTGMDAKRLSAALFYSELHGNRSLNLGIEEFSRRRRNRAFADVAAILAIIIAMVTSGIQLVQGGQGFGRGKPPILEWWIAMLLWAMVILLLSRQAKIELEAQKDLLFAWAMTDGAKPLNARLKLFQSQINDATTAEKLRKLMCEESRIEKV